MVLAFLKSVFIKFPSSARGFFYEKSLDKKRATRWVAQIGRKKEFVQTIVCTLSTQRVVRY